MMPRLLAILLLAAPAGAASAADMTLDYQAVMHVTKARAAPVLDGKTHRIGIGAFSGVAILADGELARHRYEGWFDLSEGSGPFHGYALRRIRGFAAIGAVDTATKAAKVRVDCMSLETA